MIPAVHPHLHIAAATHPGLRGKINEDRYSITAYRFASDDHTPTVLALLADGIGGHRAGEVAAQLAVDNISKFVIQSSTNSASKILKQAFIFTNQLILNRSDGDPALAGMGTTCVCAWVIGDRLYATSVGDSRLYLQRGAELTCLTIDHNWIQEALAQGSLTPEQARSHPNAHIIRRFLGSKNEINPDMRLRLNPIESDAQAEANQGIRLLPGDRLLLCSDGLTDLVTDGEILEILRNRSLELSPVELIDLANKNGGHDNITVVAMEIPQPADVTRPVHVMPLPRGKRPHNSPRSTISWIMLISLSVAILLMLSLLIYIVMYR